MNGVDRLLACFDSGRLVRPSAEKTNFVDLVRAMLCLAGAEGIDPGPGGDRITKLVGPADHVVFILIDGLGLHQLGKLPAEGLLRTHAAGELQAVFPPTTASAMSTLATAAWPCDHAIPGWWVYLEQAGLSATALRFVERFSQRPLEEFGLSAADVFPLPSVWPAVGRGALSVLGEQILDSTFSRYARGDTVRAGYGEIPAGLGIVRDGVAGASQPTFTYLYLPQLDSICHKKGVDHDQANHLLGRLDEQLGDFAEALTGRARVVISADHGMVDVPAERTFILEADDPIVSDLICPPTGEPTLPICHVRPGRERAFLDAFARRFGEAFIFITPEEAEDLRLFGPGRLCPLMRRRLGTFLGIAPEPAAVFFRPRVGDFHVHVGVHAGMSREEMTIPLIVV